MRTGRKIIVVAISWNYQTQRPCQARKGLANLSRSILALKDLPNPYPIPKVWPCSGPTAGTGQEVKWRREPVSVCPALSF